MMVLTQDIWRCRFGRVRSLLTLKSANAIVVCLILSKLDYCNSLLAGLPQTQIKRLQAVQNAVARGRGEAERARA